jgi:hypothetical protein
MWIMVSWIFVAPLTAPCSILASDEFWSWFTSPIFDFNWSAKEAESAPLGLLGIVALGAPSHRFFMIGVISMDLS